MSTLSSLTNTEESLDKTVERAHAALDLLSGALIPPTPPRFAVAYAHHLGAVPDLTLALTRLIGHERLNAEAVDEFYHQFLATDPNQAELDAASRKIQSAVGDVAEQIGSSSVRHQSFADGLEGFAGALVDGKATSSQAQALLSLTREIGQDHKQLHDRLGQTMRELDVLRTQLDRLEREARNAGNHEHGYRRTALQPLCAWMAGTSPAMTMSIGIIEAFTCRRPLRLRRHRRRRPALAERPRPRPRPSPPPPQRRHRQNLWRADRHPRRCDRCQRC